jgi:hypothetical protein
MSLAQGLGLVSANCLSTCRINDALRNHNVEEIAQYIRSSEDFDVFMLNCPPVSEELGRHLSDAILQNSHISELRFCDTDVVAWIESRNTLVNMTSLETVRVYARDDMSALDCTALFPLLLTSTSLRNFDISFQHDNGCSDDVMSALSSYLRAASLREFRFGTKRMSEAAFTALCEGVAFSAQFILLTDLFPELNLSAAESLARMIVESSLEEVAIADRVSTWSESERLISALQLTAPVRNVDFAFTHVVDRMHGLRTTRLMINRKWKPLIFGANTPLALWPHILEKSHASPETSHGSADMVFYVLKEKPDLVPSP